MKGAMEGPSPAPFPSDGRPVAGQGFRGKGGAEAGETPVAGRLGEWGGCCPVLLATGSVL